eukprot:750804-Lingulodinium_polyedra.AAC.1
MKRKRKRAASGCDDSRGQQDAGPGNVLELLQAACGGKTQGRATSSAQPDPAASAAEQMAGQE